MTDYRSVEVRTLLPRIMLRLFGLWELSLQDQLVLLGYSAKSKKILLKYKGGAIFPFRKDLIIRAVNLINIHNSLESLVGGDLQQVLTWIKSPNSGEVFAGSSPLEVMKRDLEGLRAARSYLDWMRQA